MLKLSLKLYFFRLYALYEKYPKICKPLIATILVFVKAAATLFILWNPAALALLLYFYIGNLVAILRFRKTVSDQQVSRSLMLYAWNPYRQYKALITHMLGKKDYTEFSLAFWSILIGAYSITSELPLGSIFILLFIALWPTLVITEFYYKYRPKLAEPYSKWLLFGPFIIQVVTLNLAAPFLAYRAATFAIQNTTPEEMQQHE